MNAAMQEPITAYKGFDANWVCNPTGDKPFQYEIGQTYATTEPVVRCAQGGFHACEYPLDVFNYYPPGSSKFAVVKLAGEIHRDPNSDTKIAAGSITIKAEISIPTLVSNAVSWIMNQLDRSITPAATNTGDSSAATNTGYRSAATVEGKNSVAIATGYEGKAKACAGSAITVCYRDDQLNLVHIRSSMVGQNGIKPDVFYMLDKDGEFVEVAA